jgi:anthranilate synthase component 2
VTRILVVDNYDSFAYNLVQYVGEAVAERGGDPHADVLVRRNDAVSVADVREMAPDGIVVSPGPGTPAEAGVCIPLFRDLDYPALGVCLGHQALCAAAGAPVVQAPEVVHGKPSTLSHDGAGVFAGLPDRIRVGRYHSLAVERDALPEELQAVAATDDERETLMAVRHREKPHVGVQFHPESILTGEPGTHEDGTARSLWVGKRMVENFVAACEEGSA